MLQPSVVDAVSATWLGVDAEQRRERARASAARKPMTRSRNGLPPRPPARSRASCASASPRPSRARAARPYPAFRYARRSSTGKSARASSSVIRPSSRRERDPRARRPLDARRSSGQTRDRRGRGAADEHVVDPRPGADQPSSGPELARPQVEVAGEHGRRRRPVRARRRTPRPARSRGGDAWRSNVVRGVQVRDDEPRRARTAWHDAPLARPLADRRSPWSTYPSSGGRQQDRVRLPARSPSGRSPWCSRVIAPPATPGSRGRRATASAPSSRSSARAAAAPRAAPPAGRARRARRAVASSIIVSQVRAPAGRAAVAVEDVPAPDQQGHGRLSLGGRARPARRSVRLHADVRPRARRRARPRRSRRRARSPPASASAPRPMPVGYRRRELFYPSRARAFGRSRLRAAAEGARAPARAVAARPRQPPTSSTCSGSRAPELDCWLLCVPRAAGLHRPRPAAAPHGRRSAISGAGCSAASSGRRPQPSAAGERSQSSASRRRSSASSLTPSSRATRRAPTTARTVLALGVIRPYKRLDHADEAVRRARRRPGCSSRAIRSEPLTDRASAGAELRLGYLPEAEIERGARRGDGRRLPLPRRARPVRRAPAGARRRRAGGRLRRRRPRPSRSAGYGAGRVVPAGDVEALASALEELLGDPAALERRARRRPPCPRRAHVGRIPRPPTSRCTGSSP